VKNGSTRSPTVTSNASASRSVVPAPGDLLAPICASAVCVPVTRSISTSTLPPLAFWPKKRAFSTLVSLNTSRSPRAARRQLGEAAIDEARGRHGAVDLEQAARGALGQRGLGDQLGRQIEIEIGEREHAGWFGTAGGRRRQGGNA
jgi:hypothetical protein